MGCGRRQHTNDSLSCLVHTQSLIWTAGDIPDNVFLAGSLSWPETTWKFIIIFQSNITVRSISWKKFFVLFHMRITSIYSLSFLPISIRHLHSPGTHFHIDTMLGRVRCFPSDGFALTGVAAPVPQVKRGATRTLPPPVNSTLGIFSSAGESRVAQS